MDKINFENLPSKKTPLSAEILNILQDNMEKAIENVVANNFESVGHHTGLIEIGNLRIEYGRQYIDTVPSSSYLQTTIYFTKAFSETPNFFAQTNGNYNILTTVSSNDKTQAIVNTRSLNGSEVTGRWFDWFAIGKA